MLDAIHRQVIAAYEAGDRDIPDSDLDDEQPITLLVRTTLGEVRRIRRLGLMLDRGARASEREDIARREQEANT
jgi:hypothetical protein